MNVIKESLNYKEENVKVALNRLKAYHSKTLEEEIAIKNKKLSEYENTFATYRKITKNYESEIKHLERTKMIMLNIIIVLLFFTVYFILTNIFSQN